MLPEMPTKVPVYFGPKSAWFTPNPPAQIPVQSWIRHNKKIALNKVSCREIKYKKIAYPKNPIELTVFLTLITLYPLFIKLSDI